MTHAEPHAGSILRPAPARRIFREALRGALVAGGLAMGCARGPVSDTRTATVDVGPVEQQALFEGRLEARRVEVIMSQFSGPAVIVELAPEGARVAPGDLLVRFDDTQLQRDLVNLERDVALAQADVTSLEQALLPMERSDLELKILEAREAWDSERQYSEDSAALRDEGLVSDQEWTQLKVKAERMRAHLDLLERQRELTVRWLHPSRLERARASLDAAKRALAFAQEQRARCQVLSPAAGLVAYRPLHFGAEYRTVRVGDTVFQNQPFMEIPDLADMVVQVLVPEADLAHVTQGLPATVTPLAYPNVVVAGRVERLGAMAQDEPGRPSWQKYFRMSLALEKGEDRLRPGMTVHALIRSARREQALRIPRAAVRWQSDGSATVCRAGAAGRPAEDCTVRVGLLSDQYAEILEGLQAGDCVQLP